MPTYFVYIVQCSDETLYTGWTNDIAKRVEQHNLGKGAKYTRTRRPVAVVYSESLPTREAAMQREYEIKCLSRKDKMGLIKANLKAA